jgi:O-antigen/teichoic acid export membrane protein
MILRFLVHLAARILPPAPTGLFLAATILQCSLSPFSTYVLALKKQPFAYTAVPFGILVALSNWYLGGRYGAAGMGAGYLGLTLAFLPVVTGIWWFHRAQWRASIDGARMPFRHYRQTPV